MLQEEMLKTLLVSSRCSRCSAAIPLVTPCSWHSQRLQKADCAGGGGRFSLATTKPSLAVDNLEAVAKSSRNSAAKVLKDGFLRFVIPFWLPHCNSWLQPRNAGRGRGYLRYFLWCTGHVEALVIARRPLHQNNRIHHCFSSSSVSTEGFLQ